MYGKKNWIMQGSSAMHSEGQWMCSKIARKNPVAFSIIKEKYRFGENRKKNCIKLSEIREVIHNNNISRKL